MQCGVHSCLRQRAISYSSRHGSAISSLGRGVANLPALDRVPSLFSCQKAEPGMAHAHQWRLCICSVAQQGCRRRRQDAASYSICRFVDKIWAARGRLVLADKAESTAIRTNLMRPALYRLNAIASQQGALRVQFLTAAPVGGPQIHTLARSHRSLVQSPIFPSGLSSRLCPKLFHNITLRDNICALRSRLELK